ncbi:MAG TPA: UvrD-helicase domain-containing protein [Burkholderiaceae bacterium]|jgi:DNA helicase-2/ATP-dependent DNA helicase PcrA
MTSPPPFTPRGIRLTDEQRAIVEAADRLVIAEANAGAAKTTTLACRIGAALAAGTAPASVLALTYTDAAVQALRQAMARVGIAAAARDAVQVWTFEEFSARCLVHLEGARVVRHRTPEPAKRHVLEAIADAQANPGERYPQALNPHGEASVEGLLAAFAWLKGTLLLATEAADQRMTPALADELGLDYTTLRIFASHEALRYDAREERPAFRLAGDATYDLAMRLGAEDAVAGDEPLLPTGLALVALDEMHDTNRAMFSVLRQVLAANPDAAFIGVGDRDQVLHAVAGADAGFMGALFDAAFGPPRRLPLTASYRFGEALAGPVGRIAGKPCVSRCAWPTEVVVVACDADVGGGAAPLRSDQAVRVVEAMLDPTGLPPKTPRSEIAVLLRRPHQSMELENRLLDLGEAYVTEGFESYLLRREIHFVRGVIAHALDAFDTIERAETRLQVLEALMLFTQSAIDSDEQRAGRERATLAEVAAAPQHMAAFVRNQVLRNAEPATRRLIEAASACLQAPEAGVEVLAAGFADALALRRIAAKVIVRAADVDQIEANGRALLRSAAGFHSIESFLRELTAREWRLGSTRSKDHLLLASIEAVKGLEFEHVLIPALDEFSASADRNLLYVGMTRAKRRLTLFRDASRPNAWLTEAGLLPAA